MGVNLCGSRQRGGFQPASGSSSSACSPPSASPRPTCSLAARTRQSVRRRRFPPRTRRHRRHALSRRPLRRRRLRLLHRHPLRSRLRARRTRRLRHRCRLRRLRHRRVVMRSRNYAGALVAVALVTPLVARGAPDASGSDQYSAAITPTAVQPSQSALYEIDLKSHPRAPDSANEAEIDIPDGFSIDTSPIAITSCSATVWDATVDTAASRIVATSAPGAELCPGGTLSVSFSATGPAGE